MQKRSLGKCGQATSLLGFGCMRLPQYEGEETAERKFGDIDERKAIPLLRAAIDAGVTYIDTAYTYHGQKSELLVGEALKGGYRDQVLLATKMPVWLVNEEQDFERIFSEQLQKLQVDHVDVYLAHSLNANSWKKAVDCGLLPFLERIRSEGRAKCIGFSFHDEVSVFHDILAAFDWDVCQIQLNFMDEQYQAGLEGLTAAADRGLGVIVMEPLRGGQLVGRVPAEVQTIWEGASQRRSAAHWAFRYLGDKPEISVILSGMHSWSEVEENMAALDDSFPGCLSDEERQRIAKVRNVYRQRLEVLCTDCRYCMPCPHGVNIPRVFELFNQAAMYDSLPGTKQAYQMFLVQRESDASRCVECGQCEPLCPQNITIIADLKRAHEVLAETDPQNR